jgi:hypothetical protein
MSLCKSRFFGYLGLISGIRAVERMDGPRQKFTVPSYFVYFGPHNLALLGPHSVSGPGKNYRLSPPLYGPVENSVVPILKISSDSFFSSQNYPKSTPISLLLDF